MNRTLFASICIAFLLGLTGCRCGATVSEDTDTESVVVEGTGEALPDTQPAGEITFMGRNSPFFHERVIVLMEEVRTGVEEGRDVTTECLAAASYARELARESHPDVLAVAEDATRFCRFELPLSDVEGRLESVSAILAEDPASDVEDHCFLAGAKLRHIELFETGDERVTRARAEHDRVCP